MKGSIEMVRETHSKEIAIMKESINHINKIICNPVSVYPLDKFILFID